MNETVNPSGRSRSLLEMVEQTAPPPIKAEKFSAQIWVKILIVAGLLVAVNVRQFPVLWEKWKDPNWSHGIAIPLFSLFLLFMRRNELYAAPRKVCLWGLPLMVLSLLFIVVSFYPIQTYWFCQLGMVALIFSTVLYLGGTSIIKLTWLPIVFLAFAMPIPDLLYGRIAVPLQELAAKFSASTLMMLGVKIKVTASHLSMISVSGQAYELTVVEACSGVRSLMAFLALGVAWAYLESRPVWQRVVLVLLAMPIAILCNVLRVTITSSAYVLDHPEFGQKFMHEFTGMLMLIPAVLMFWGLGKLLNALFMESEEEEDTPEDSGKTGEVQV